MCKAWETKSTQSVLSSNQHPSHPCWMYDDWLHRNREFWFPRSPSLYFCLFCFHPLRRLWSWAGLGRELCEHHCSVRYILWCCLLEGREPRQRQKKKHTKQTGGEGRLCPGLPSRLIEEMGRDLEVSRADVHHGQLLSPSLLDFGGVEQFPHHQIKTAQSVSAGFLFQR